MNSITQKIIDKIKRSITTTDTDIVIATKIGDVFEDIKTDTGFAFAFVDETNFEITPSIADDSMAPFRLAMFYKVCSNHVSRKQDDAAGKAVRVKSGRDEVDTTRTAGAYKDSVNKKEAEYLKCINAINLKYGSRAIAGMDDGD